MTECLNNAHQLRRLVADCSEVVDTGFSFAFQPIVDMDTLKPVAHEALLRGLGGEPAASVIGGIRPENRYLFDQACGMRALRLFARLGRDVGNGCGIHLNCSSIRPENLSLSLNTTRECAEENGVDPGRVVLEFGKLERLGSPRELDRTRAEAEASGFRVLADNIGGSEVGLKRLAVFRPQYAKLDRNLVHGIDSSLRRQAIVHGLIAMARTLDITLIAGGVERTAERDWLHQAGVRLAQGYLFARPVFEQTAGTIANAA